MRKHLLVGLLATLVAIASTAPAAAQGNSGGPDASVGLGADEGALGTVVKTLNATSNHFAVRYQCSDPTGTSTSISVAVADGFIAGDIWGATVHKGVKATLFRSTANQNPVREAQPLSRPGHTRPTRLSASASRKWTSSRPCAARLPIVHFRGHSAILAHTPASRLVAR